MKRIIVILIMAVLVSQVAAAQVCARQVDVPKYSPIALAAVVSGVVDLSITVGAQGKVTSVEGTGLPMLVEAAKENVKRWVFCEPEKNQITHFQLRYDYRIKGARIYRVPPAKVIIDLEAGTVVITSRPPEIEE
jgi:TonB family protein